MIAAYSPPKLEKPIACHLNGSARRPSRMTDRYRESAPIAGGEAVSALRDDDRAAAVLKQRVTLGLCQGGTMTAVP